MKNIVIILTTILISTALVNAEEKTVGRGDCVETHKISPKAFGCGVKNLFKKKDGTPNALGKFYNTKTLKDLFWKK